MATLRTPLLLLGGLALLGGGLYLAFPDAINARLVKAFSPSYAVSDSEGSATAQAPDPDAGRARISIKLEPVAEGFEMITDIGFVPGADSLMVVAQKAGRLSWVDLDSQERGTLGDVSVVTASEQGLLGVAFHPKFPADPRIFLNIVVGAEGADKTQIVSATVGAGGDVTKGALSPFTVLMEVPQPYANHNAGQVAFGPDGMLYVGFGDGGWAGDPQGHGQNPLTLLGSMTRIDVDGDRAPGMAYAIPKDNPFVGQEGVRPEIFAVGLRNPWRYSFAPDGRLVVADVGQNKWEEIAIVGAGENHGWNVWEGLHCFKKNPACGKGEELQPIDGRRIPLVSPIYEYDHSEGRSITGGFVYTGESVPALKGLYVFGDFVSGRIWAIDLPDTEAKAKGGSPKVRSLGAQPILLSTFGQDGAGEIYVGDFQGGVVHRIVPGPS